MTRGESSPLQKYLREIARRHELEGLMDAQLLQQYVAGNGDAIAELVKRLSSAVALAKEFLAQSAKTKGKKIWRLSL